MPTSPTSLRRYLSPVLLLRRRAVLGSLAGSGRWMKVLGAFWVIGVVRRAVVRQPETVTLVGWRPGDTVAVTPRRPLTRRQRRAARPTR